MKLTFNPTGFCLSQLKHSHIPPNIREDIKRRGFEDLKQEIALALIEYGLHPFEAINTPQARRKAILALSKALYRTAKMLGYRKTRRGWIDEKVVDPQTV